MYIEYTHCTKKPHLAYLASTCNHRDALHLHTLHNSSTRWRGVRYDENTQNIITSTETIWAEPPRLHLSHDPRPHHHFASYVFYFPVPPCILAGEIVLFLPGFFFYSAHSSDGTQQNRRLCSFNTRSFSGYTYVTRACIVVSICFASHVLVKTSTFEGDIHSTYPFNA